MLQVAEDKTFGLKNKNKSKVVQQFVKQVHQQIPTSADKEAEAAKRKVGHFSSLFSFRVCKGAPAQE